MTCAKLKCRCCKERFPRESILKVNGGNFCSMDCMTDYGLRKGRKELQRKERAQTRQDKERIRTRTKWYQILQILVNQYVLSVRDKDKPCFTCRTTNDIKYDAGHFIPVGRNPDLRFEETNIHKQCSMQCNQYKSGNEAEYEKQIIRHYGKSHLEWLRGPHEPLKSKLRTTEDIKSEILRYRKLIRDAGLKPNA